ncbi:MAG: integrin alpha, partial [Candidatus Methylomirabilis sp.]
MLDDLDGDGRKELAVGAGGADDPGGAVWILFLNTDGTVKDQRKISATRGGFKGHLDQYDFFGRSVVSLGDLDGNGIGDLAVGAIRDDDGGTDRGAVWVLFMGGMDRFSPFPGTVHPGGTITLPLVADGEEPKTRAPSTTAIPFVLLATRTNTIEH